MGYNILGIILIGLGVLCIFFRRKKQRKLFEIKATPTSTAKDLTDMCKSVNEEMGTTGGFKQDAEVEGVVKCDKPLFGEVSEQPCVFYETTMTQQSRRSDGKWETQTLLPRNTQRVKFYVQDQTGTILVNPNDASVDAEVFRRLNKGGVVFTEKIIPLDRDVYVLGEATDVSGQLMMQASSEKGKPFIITLQSKEELKRATENLIKNLMTGAMVLWIIGAALITYGIFRMP